MRSLVSVWHGVYLVDGDRVVRSVPVPLDAPLQAERTAQRQRGERTPEETAIVDARGTERWVTRDRRLVTPEIAYDRRAVGAAPVASEMSRHRELLLAAAEAALAAAWDPSIHVEEAVRAVRDLDRAANLVGERLASWGARDAVDGAAEDADGAARRLLEPGEASPLAPSDPALSAARRALAELYRSIGATRAALDEAVNAAVPDRTPNLNSLLGPELTGALLAQAGGLDRLARLPSSTVQVLGAEKAFFAHLRGRAPPPRHGLLFLHPTIQGAPRRDRGKLARALAGKVAIAARRDAVGAAADAGLKTAYDRRAAAVRAQRRPAGGKRSRPPLDRTSDDG